jgi:hypothetical protein
MSSLFATTFTPLLNTPRFSEVFGGEDGCSLPLDGQGLIRAVETIAFPNTKFQIVDKIDAHIVQVATGSYPCASLFADSRFLSASGQERALALPPLSLIIERLYTLVGTPYVWGGNQSGGIPELLHFYPPKRPLDETMDRLWQLKGVDCSGLLYEAANGATPRNTSWLVHFGKAVPIAHLSLDKIPTVIKPLDLIVWPGHLIIVLDDKTCVESRPESGVTVQPLLDRLVSMKRAPLDAWQPSHAFVIRRWCV